MAASNLPQDDDLFIRASRREKAVSDEQITEGQNLQERMREMGLKPKPLGEILQERGYLTQERLDELLETVNRVKESFRIPGFTRIL